MAKSTQITKVLTQRIRQGDYRLREFPSVNQLAKDLRSNPRTVTKAVEQLVGDGLLRRTPTGRLRIEDEAAGQTVQVALLQPAFPSPQYEYWARAAERVGYDVGVSVRPVNYAHWDDPVIDQALGAFDGALLLQSSERMPSRARELFQQCDKLIALDTDLSALGVPSLRMTRPEWVHQLGDHLLSLGHKRIDCLNTQPGGAIIDELIAQWKLWLALNNVQGEVHDQPVEPYTHATPGAYRTMSRLLEAQAFTATALVCLTEAAATGAIRACHEHGLVTGKDISICSVESNYELTAYEVPSRTALIYPKPDRYLQTCLRWIAGDAEPWAGPLLIQPPAAKLFEGESTTRPPRRSAPRRGVRSPQLAAADQSITP